MSRCVSEGVFLVAQLPGGTGGAGVIRGGLHWGRRVW